jgi:hypothetical protein
MLPDNPSYGNPIPVLPRVPLLFARHWRAAGRQRQAKRGGCSLAAPRVAYPIVHAGKTRSLLKPR